MDHGRRSAVNISKVKLQPRHNSNMNTSARGRLVGCDMSKGAWAYDSYCLLGPNSFTTARSPYCGWVPGVSNPCRIAVGNW
jgi:hypothetical protein